MEGNDHLCYNSLMRFEIEIHRPWSLFAVTAGVVGFVAWANGFIEVNVGAAEPTVITKQEQSNLPASLIGGSDTDAAVRDIVATELDIKRTRQERAVLAQREEIMRHQLQVIQLRLEQGEPDPRVEEELKLVRQKLIALLNDTRQAEDRLRAAFNELWEAQERAGRISVAVRGQPAVLSWPVEPVYGLSAGFMDNEYEMLFGLPHQGIDIPTEQGTEIRSPADGVVEQVVDNGLGYSYLIMRHQGVVTLYGHASAFLVSEGATVTAGQTIALSGGQPGSRGAGALTTGPHLHFEVIRNGEHIDPLSLLPRHQKVEL